jgi:broad specificity phosphatase PhoE
MHRRSAGEVYLVRHGETAWSLTGQHTGATDLPLTAHGEAQARGLEARLEGLSFTHILSSPLRRARRTCELAGVLTRAVLDPDLVEWDYGDYEGRTTEEIHRTRPGWIVFRDGCPGGESVAQVTKRVDRIISKARALASGVLVFSSGHLLRALAARWLGLSVECGRSLALDPAAVCVLGYEHGGADRVIRLWNDTRHSSQAHLGVASRQTSQLNARAVP